MVFLKFLGISAFWPAKEVIDIWQHQINLIFVIIHIWSNIAILGIFLIELRFRLILQAWHAQVHAVVAAGAAVRGAFHLAQRNTNIEAVYLIELIVIENALMVILQARKLTDIQIIKALTGQ